MISRFVHSTNVPHNIFPFLEIVRWCAARFAFSANMYTEYQSSCRYAPQLSFKNHGAHIGDRVYLNWIHGASKVPRLVMIAPAASNKCEITYL